MFDHREISENFIINNVHEYIRNYMTYYWTWLRCKLSIDNRAISNFNIIYKVINNLSKNSWSANINDYKLTKRCIFKETDILRDNQLVILEIFKPVPLSLIDLLTQYMNFYYV